MKYQIAKVDLIARLSEDFLYVFNNTTYHCYAFGLFETCEDNINIIDSILHSGSLF